jgi:hypothetical protein
MQHALHLDAMLVPFSLEFQQEAFMVGPGL